MNRISVLDAADAVEVTDILEHVIEPLDRRGTHDHTTRLCADPTGYDVDVLRADLARGG